MKVKKEKKKEKRKENKTKKQPLPDFNSLHPYSWAREVTDSLTKTKTKTNKNKTKQTNKQTKQKNSHSRLTPGRPVLVMTQ